MKEKIWKICTCAVIKCEDEFLVIKRPDEEEDMAGVWEFPSGNAKTGEDLFQALKREVFEETGLEFSNQEKIISTSQYISEKQNYIKCTVQINYLIEFEEKPIVILSEEHTDFAWVKKDSNSLDKFLLNIINKI